MVLFPILLVLPLVICVTGQGNQPIYRSRPVPVLGRPRPVRPTSQPATPVPQPPVPVYTQPPIPVVTQPPAPVYTQPPVPIPTQPPTPIVTRPPPAPFTPPPVVFVTQPPVAVVTQPPPPPITEPPFTATQPPAVVETQPPVVIEVEIPPATNAPPAVVPPQPPVVTPPQVPVEPEDEPATYEPEPEPEPETKPNPLPEPEPAGPTKLEPSSQPELQPAPQPEPDVPPVPEVEVSSISYASPPKINAPLKYGPTSRPVAARPPSGVLPPLLPQPKPVREPIFGRETAPTTRYPITVTTQRMTKAPPVFVTPPPTPRPGFKQDFVCKEGNGYYAVENECDTYIECKYNKATILSCPDGLHFNPAAKRYEYPCAYPSIVQCKAGTERQNPRPTSQCPRQYGFYPTSDGDCSKYIVCQEGEATLMNCPAGLVFNPTVQSCDYAENVPNCNANVFKNYVCPEPPIDENGLVSDIVYKYRYEQQCKYYVACKRGYPRLLSCEHGLSFDEASQSCIDEDYVPNCVAPR